MPAETVSPAASPLFDPHSWIDLITVYAMQSDVFSVRTLTVVHEGIDKLSKALKEPDTKIAITPRHQLLFERLRKSFSNPHLLKEVGQAYLEDFRLPAVAQKHLDLAREFAPNDRDIEQLRVNAALAVAREMTAVVDFSGLEEAAPIEHESDLVLRNTVRLSQIADTRQRLEKGAGELGRRQDERKESKRTKSEPKAAGPFQEPLARAQDLVSRADFANATTALVEAEKTGAPREDLQAGYAQLGLTAFDRGNMDVALDAFLKERDLSPETIEGWFNCGLVYQKMGRFDDALAAYREAIRIAPDNAKPWCNLSSAWYEHGDPVEAENAARESLKLKEDYARAWDNLASALSAQQRPAEAAEACKKAIKIQPALLSAWFKYGVISFQLDNMVEAAEAFHATESSPVFAGYVQYYLAMVFARRGELEHAVEQLQVAREADSTNELETPTVKEIAGAFTKAGDYKRAASLYSQITKKDPADFSGWLALGTALHRAREIAAARESYLKATMLRPDNPLAWHNLGMLASDQGKPEEARSFFQREVDLAPNDAKAWYDLGVSLKKLGLEDESTEAFEKAESLVKSLTRRSSDLSAAMTIVRRINLTGRTTIKTE